MSDALQDAEIRWKRITGSLAKQGVTWHFIPSLAPHFSGLWKAGVKAMELGPRHLTYKEFSTVLASIEVFFTRHPFTPPTRGLNGLDILTPGHLVVGSPLNSVLEISTLPTKLDHLSHWKLVRKI
ncbi:uncharacterized protein LOC106647224 [Copidosoma floridanum]|uniref:uncharacterized protein LOC106647224 n=1 Tax=Copidosoma floridanum TaxID=29053 RepID=UPI0006C989F7|nr:uncharacterized protein LOC106647224 [Copidosoma floridanum]